MRAWVRALALILALLLVWAAGVAVAGLYIEYRTAGRLQRAEQALCEALRALGRGSECEQFQERLRLKYKEREQ